MQTIEEIAIRSNLLIGRYKEILSSFDNLETFADAMKWDFD